VKAAEADGCLVGSALYSTCLADK